MRFLIRLSVATYRALLTRYPRELLRTFGDEMCGLFEEDLERAVRAHGMRGFLRAWSRVLVDYVQPLPGSIVPVAAKQRQTRTLGKEKEGTMTRWVVGWREDVGFAWRSLRRESGFLATMVLVLGLGFALNGSVFAVVNAYLLRPLPYPAADRVVSVRSPVDVTWSDAEDLFEKRVSWDLDAFTIVGEAGPQMARGAWVTPDFLEVYGVDPVLGRIFAPDEGGTGGASVALISFGLWQNRYGGDPNVLGRTFRAYTSDRPEDAEAFIIVGVLPRDFWHFNAYTEVLAPLREDRALYAGRLREDVPLGRAEQILNERVRDRIATSSQELDVTVLRLQDLHVESVRPTLWTLQAAALLVFLIACANAAVLLLVRSARRERELGVRRALGAANGRLARQLTAEGILIAGSAVLLGILLSWSALVGLREIESLTLWRTIPGGTAALRLDATVLGAMVGLCGLTGIAFGLVPLVSVWRQDLVSALIDGGRGSTDTAGRRRARSVMVATEIALSLALLTGAGLMVRSAINLQRQDLGFHPDGMFRGQVGLRQASYPNAEDRVAFFETMVARVQETPGVEAVGMVSAVPFTWRYFPRGVETEDNSTGEGVVQLADGLYYGAMGIGLKRGRSFVASDVLGAERVAVISETLAQDLWPNSDPLGKRLRVIQSFLRGDPTEPDPWATVVGVVSDVRKNVDGPEAGDLYYAQSQAAPHWMNLVVRHRPGAGSPVSQIESVLAGLDPDVPFSTVLDLSEAVSSATAPSKFLAALFGAFAGFALLLAVLGLYGVMSYAARQHRKDVAIRLALGADRGSVTRLFLQRSLVVLTAGLALGAFGGRMLASALADQLHGIAPDDPTTLAAVTLLLGGTALVAAWLPARRAGQTPPMSVLREE